MKESNMKKYKVSLTIKQVCQGLQKSSPFYLNTKIFDNNTSIEQIFGWAEKCKRQFLQLGHPDDYKRDYGDEFIMGISEDN